MTSGMAIYDTMQFVKPPVSTLCIGQAASMGSLSSAPGKRNALHHAQFRIMVHQPPAASRGRRPTSSATPKTSLR